MGSWVLLLQAGNTRSIFRVFVLFMKKNSSFVVYPQFWRWWFGLVETASSEVVGDNDVSHRVEHELHVLCICGAGHMTVDLFGC